MLNEPNAERKDDAARRAGVLKLRALALELGRRVEKAVRCRDACDAGSRMRDYWNGELNALGLVREHLLLLSSASSTPVTPELLEHNGFERQGFPGWLLYIPGRFSVLWRNDYPNVLTVESFTSDYGSFSRFHVDDLCDLQAALDLCRTGITLAVPVAAGEAPEATDGAQGPMGPADDDDELFSEAFWRRLAAIPGIDDCVQESRLAEALAGAGIISRDTSDAIAKKKTPAAPGAPPPDFPPLSGDEDLPF